jgi:putative redox protein
MVEIDIVYKGELRCLATHQPSSTVLTTDAPKDNHGKGEGFSPTDLVATALGTCILTMMGIAAQSMQIDLSGTKVVVRKEMVAKPIRRIGTLAVTVDVPLSLGEAQRQKLINVAMTCPVHKSMHPDVQMPIDFRWA